MLQLFTRNEAGTLVPVNTPITFTDKLIATNDSRCVNVPATQITLQDPGYYIVHFDANFEADVAGTVGVSMFVDGDEYLGATTGLITAPTGSPQNAGFTAIVHVRRSCNCVCNTKSLQFIVQGVNALVFDANVVITRLD